MITEQLKKTDTY